MDELLQIAPIDLKGSIIAVVCGLTIGFERQWSGKPAGIRTSILICISAYTFVAIANYYQPDGGAIRVVGQIITGVGFLGAGVIIAREGLVLGVTSAAVIWVLAAIGCLIGLKNYNAAIGLSLLSIFVLVGINFLEVLFKKLKRGVHKELKNKNDDKEDNSIDSLT